MNTPQQPRIFCFTDDSGAREDLSIIHESILVVSSGPGMADALTTLVESIIKYDPISNEHQFDRYQNADETRVINKLKPRRMLHRAVRRRRHQQGRLTHPHHGRSGHQPGRPWPPQGAHHDPQS